MSKNNRAYPMTHTEMVDAEMERKKTRIYKAESNEITDARISESVARIGAELEEMRINEKVDLNDTERVKTRSAMYIDACAEASSMPTMSGFAHSMGISRRALYDFSKHNPSHPTTKWIEIVNEAIEDVLSESALRNNVNAIPAIFLLKARFGLRESVEVVGRTEESIIDALPADALIEQAKSLPQSDNEPDDIESLFDNLEV